MSDAEVRFRAATANARVVITRWLVVTSFSRFWFLWPMRVRWKPGFDASIRKVLKDIRAIFHRKVFALLVSGPMGFLA